MFHKPKKSVLIGLAAFMGSCVQAALNFLIPVEGSIEVFCQEVDFLVMMSRDSSRQTINRAMRMINLMLSSIALTSLLAGGFGVMKIMLWTVVERAIAMGIGMAVGACRRDRLLRFLVEAGTVCPLGDTPGICTALPLGMAFDQSECALQTISSSRSNNASFGLSAFTGIVPARPKAGLDTLEALEPE